MSDCGDEPAATAGAGSNQCVSTTLTSELIAALTAVQSVTPAAPADSLPAADDAAAASATSNEKRAAAGVSEDVTSPPAVRSKSQTSRKRCGPTEVCSLSDVICIHAILHSLCVKSVILSFSCANTTL